MRNFCTAANAIFFLLVGSMLASCASYRQNIMFKVPEGHALKAQVASAEKNYTVQKNDLLKLEVYTNKGERLIDPEAVLSKDKPTTTVETPPSYLVDSAGYVKFPLINSIKLETLTIREAEAVLQDEYSKYYQDPFIILSYLNKRVIVLGAPGGQVIPLTNENIRLTEVLALAKGVSNDARATNIRVLRGDEVMVADLSTIDGYHKYNYIINPGDIIYVEPIRRPLSEGLRDYGPVISIITSLSTLIVVIVGL